MNGKNTAEEFNRELDGLISGAGAASAVSDPEAMEIAGKLLRADFSADSGIKETLRARLVAAQAAPAIAAEEPGLSFRALLKSFLPVALAAACVLLVVVPVMRRNAPVQPVVPAVPPQVARPGVPGEVKPALRLAPTAPVRAAAAEPAEEDGLFGSIPMAGLGSGHGQDFPIETKKGGFPISVHEGHKTEVPGGEGIVLETEGAVFILERRAISMDDVFERKSL